MPISHRQLWRNKEAFGKRCLQNNRGYVMSAEATIEVLSQDVKATDEALLSEERKQYTQGSIQWKQGERVLFELTDIMVTLVKTVYNNKVTCTYFLTFRSISHGHTTGFNQPWPQLNLAFYYDTPSGRTELERIGLGTFQLNCRNDTHQYVGSFRQEAFSLVTHAAIPQMTARFSPC